MYGTVALVYPKPDKEQELFALVEKWWTERRPKVQGAVSSTLSRQDINPGELLLAVIFESKEAYEANANDPEQNAWFQQMMACCVKEPRWFDGEVVQHYHV